MPEYEIVGTARLVEHEDDVGKPCIAVKVNPLESGYFVLRRTGLNLKNPVLLLENRTRYPLAFRLKDIDDTQIPPYRPPVDGAFERVRANSKSFVLAPYSDEHHKWYEVIRLYTRIEGGTKGDDNKLRWKGAEVDLDDRSLPEGVHRCPTPSEYPPEVIIEC